MMLLSFAFGLGRLDAGFRGPRGLWIFGFRVYDFFVCLFFLDSGCCCSQRFCSFVSGSGLALRVCGFRLGVCIESLGV